MFITKSSVSGLSRLYTKKSNIFAHKEMGGGGLRAVSPMNASFFGRLPLADKEKNRFLKDFYVQFYSYKNNTYFSWRQGVDLSPPFADMSAKNSFFIDAFPDK